MPRKGPAPRREILPDPVYHNVLVARFINRLFIDGKKSVGERIFYGALDQIRDRSGKDPVEVFEQAVRNTMPAVEVKSRRVGGSTYQVPVEVRPARRETLAIRWLITNARRRGGRTMVDKLASELLDAAQGQGASVKKREDTHRMAEANKAFAHYRW
ncbi:MAG TPA: 30S ribosomal protein S7 [Armatimonadota bacterium]|nr:30S ribosomal protein S7 [Armatimonadota bacterium]HOJ23477.1 30S ribosomal protein S7 [Armatimonadota bacterium]HOM83644.1 30S ribosomal protein S7 [Armatimonadota bacterium]HOQ28925.1 30S ribosomal protein S7 [Armatimonadota bacterium]HPO74725.1 30S ribosomal protein S7 [Armatimonadota bacterium]